MLNSQIMDPFSEPISRLTDVVIHVINTTLNFKPQLEQLKNTLDRIKPIIADIQNQNQRLDCPSSEQNMFIKEILDAQNLVNQCLKIKYFQRYTHSKKLTELDQKLVRFFQIEVQAVQCRDIKKTLEEVSHVRQTLDNGGSMPRSGQRKNLGWQVPSLPRGIVGFDEPLKELKDTVLSDISNVVVVSAAGGCGKTTLVKMLCNDPQIQGIFGGNVFFVTASETPDFMVSVNDFFNPNSFDRQVKFQGSEDAKNKLESFLHEKVSAPILLVLDDVWDESYIENFEFDIEGYKLLVTSRMNFPKYNVFNFYPLSDEHAKIVFCNSAKPVSTIDENLVDQIVICCKNHPLTLSVVGGSLNGKNQVAWKSMLKSLSQGQLILDLNQKVLHHLERSFEALEDKFKQCFLDFGLFLEDHRIAASALLDMWAHLYNHDDKGIDTLAKIHELSYRNLVNIMTRGSSYYEIPYASADCCKYQFVTQHDLLRQLAINLNSKLPVAERPRLIISAQNDLLITNVQGEDKVAPIEQIQEPMLARLLCVSTGESFSSRWCNMRVPEVEVMVMNLKSETYTLPHFMKEMQKLKILNVTNYGLYITKIKDFHLLGCLSNLTRIRLERVAIPSLSKSILTLVNLQKISFIECLIENAFDEVTTDNLISVWPRLFSVWPRLVSVWPRLVEIEIDSCSDLVVYPQILCGIVSLKKISITNCHSLREISEDFSKLISLETLILCHCSGLNKLPESITKLQNLSVLDISGCSSLIKLPEQMGNIGGLKKIFISRISQVGLQVMKDLPNVEVIYADTKVLEAVAKVAKIFCGMAQ